jgi:hypothetical protein
MTMRPKNQCNRCGYTWYPRGKNVSNKCPNCGSGAVQVAPFSMMLIKVVGVFFAVSFCCPCLGFGLVGLLGKRDKDERPVANLKQQETQKEKEEDRTTHTDPEEATPSTPSKKSGSSPKIAPLDGSRLPIKPKTETKPSLEIAPPPRRVPLNRLPAGFALDWVRHGEIQTRVIGAAVLRPTLTNSAGQEFPAPDPMLLVWVETQSLTTGSVTLRRWINPLTEFVEITDTSGTRIRSARFASGARVGGQLEGGTKLVPGGPAVLDVLAFEVPTTKRSLRLALAGRHVSEGEDFIHIIPYEVWSKK